MAGFRTHLTAAAVVGGGYGAAAADPGGFPADAAALAAGLTAVGGLLPDLDSGTGRPARELFGLAAVVVPLLLLPRLERAGATQEATLLAVAGLYLAVRYGAAAAFRRLTGHRGMFHSLPAVGIAGLGVYVAYGGPDRSVRLLLAGGAALGYLTHLILDELYSVDVAGGKVVRTRSAGTALKWASRSWAGTATAYGVLLGLAVAAAAER